MSSFDSGFPSPSVPPLDGSEPEAPEQPAPLTPMHPFDEVQPLQPLQASPVESFPVKPVQELQTGEAVAPVEPAQPLEPLQPLQPTMPPPLPLLTAGGPAAVDAAPAAVVAPTPSPEAVANLGVPLGTLIFRAGLLTEEQLEDALQEGVRSGKRLGEVLLESGLIDERDLGRLLADQKGLRFVELTNVAIDRAAVDLLTAEKAHMFAALPIGFEGEAPLVAVADPSNELVTENLRRALGREPRLVVASRSDLHATIDRQHEAPSPAEQPAAEPLVAEEPTPVFVEEAAVVEQPVATVPPALVVETPQPEPAAELPPLAPLVPAEPVAADAQSVPDPVVDAAAEPPVASDPQPAAEAQPSPEPVLRPVEVAHVSAPQPEAAEPAPVAPPVSEPAPAPEPAAVTLVPEPVAPVVETAAAPEYEPEPTFSRVEEAPVREPEPAEQPGAEQELPSAVSYDVALRLSDGERVPVGSFSEPQKAREYAREVVRHLSDEAEGWPFFGGRFLRPDTIVSVDIVPVGEPDRWLGSAIRSNWASRLNR